MHKRIVFAMLLTTYLTCNAQSYRITKEEREHDWTVGSHSLRFGLQEDRKTVWEGGSMTVVADNRWTVVRLGSFDFTVGFKASTTAIVGVALLASLGLAVFIVGHRIALQRKHKEGA